ncbi:hypothetical protein J6590_012261 [Homalodisca vitripennis]|nr:hypothetical protein J6590_012261 [Homalodisca vitripennis]
MLEFQTDLDTCNVRISVEESMRCRDKCEPRFEKALHHKDNRGPSRTAGRNNRSTADYGEILSRAREPTLAPTPSYLHRIYRQVDSQLHYTG